MEILGKIFNTIIEGYGVAGVVLLVLVLVLFTIQIVQLCRMLIVAKFKQTSRPQIRQIPPPVSVAWFLFTSPPVIFKVVLVLMNRPPPVFARLPETWPEE